MDINWICARTLCPKQENNNRKTSNVPIPFQATPIIACGLSDISGWHKNKEDFQYLLHLEKEIRKEKAARKDLQQRPINMVLSRLINSMVDELVRDAIFPP